MSIDLSELEGVFFEEANEHVATMEAALLALEGRPGDRELLNQVFRAAHSIKGGSGTFGFNDLLRFTHGLEGLLHLVRDGKVSFDSALADLLLRANDALAQLVAATRRRDSPPASLDEILAEIQMAMPDDAAEAAGAGSDLPAQIWPSSTPASKEETSRTYRVRFAPGAHLFRQGMDPLLVVRDVVQLGRAREVTVDASALPDLDALDPETCYLAWTLLLDTPHDAATVRDVFAFVEDTSVVEITPVSTAADAGAAPIATPVASPIATPVVTPAATPAAPPAAPPPRMPEVASAVKPAPAAERSTVRVDTLKIDKLIDLVGELVIAQSMVNAALDGFGGPAAEARLREAVLAMDRNTRELQDRVMAVRMLPIGSVFNRFPRMVRDLSGSLGKRVNLVMSGEEVELDKGMIEKLADPLTHLVRNAIDHGIESPDDRRAAGKPEEGRLSIVAVHQGGNVVIEVQDDGRGLALEKIRDKAQALGLLPRNTEPTVEELHAVIFAPGFSTKEHVSDVSGRGVGMDVVKRNVEALNGALTFTSERGKGSRMRIRLPLTMAIIDGLTLRLGEQVFVLPLVEVVESLRPTQSQYQTVLGKGEVVRVRDQAVPLVRLHDVLSVPDAERDPCRALVCIVETRTGPVGLLVDEILGQAQVVVKTLETNFRRIDGVMGATILGDGRVALILDVQAVARRATAGPSAEKEPSHGAAGRAA